jgi:DNA-binding response OmpR family regulator
VDALGNGLDALTHLRENRPDLIVASADLESPNGLDICYRTKRIRRLKTVPVLILATRDDDHLRDHATLAQADMTLIRPLEREAVREIVRQLLTRSALGGLDTSDLDPRGTSNPCVQTSREGCVARRNPPAALIFFDSSCWFLETRVSAQRPPC